MAMLTNARRAVWQAIDESPLLVDSFVRKYKLDGDDDLTDEVEPASHSVMPAIALMPTNADGNWLVNTMMRFGHNIEVRIWTPRWHLDTAEDLVERVWKSIYGAAAVGATSTFVEAATGSPAKSLGVTFELVRVGENRKVKAVLTRLRVQVRPQQDPRTQSVT